jgi:very-short-patch-repair endonuclease
MQYHGRYQNRASLVSRRKELRNDPTTAERVLWKRIRNEQLGVKFRRQYNIDYYIVDFYCHPLKLIIELDGWVHGEEEQKRKDEIREQYLKEKGYIILRYKNEQIKYDLDAVIQDILNHIQSLPLRQTPPNLP